MKGMLRLWDSMLAESTVNLEIRQVNDPVQIKKEITWSALSWADMAYLMRSGLTRIRMDLSRPTVAFDRPGRCFAPARDSQGSSSWSGAAAGTERTGTKAAQRQRTGCT